MRARIATRDQVAAGTLLVTFDLLGETVDFEAGQYFFVNLIDPPYDDDRGRRRHFTVVTSPTERGILGLATRIGESAFKRSLADLPLGTEVDLEPPKGSFTLPPDDGTPCVFIAGGIGITPFRSMLRALDASGRSTPITLVYANRDRSSAAFLDELHDLERRHAWLRLVLVMNDDAGWDGERRSLDADVLRDHVGALDQYIHLIAGPPPMVEAVSASLRDAGLADAQIRPERFSGY